MAKRNKNHDDIHTEIPDNKIEFSDHQQCVVLQNNDDKAGIGNRGSKTKSKKDTRDDKENTQNVIKALDSTIIPLSAAVYSGVGGYAAFGPSLIGLTPAQFREIKKYEDDKSNADENIHLMTSDV